MLAQYVEVEEEKEEEEKPVTQVHFDSDYDITDVLERWGNWARQDAYLQRKAFSLFKSEQAKSKEVLNDDDALFIDAAIAQLGKINLMKSKYEYKVLMLYYFGEVKVLDDSVMIVPQSLRSIGKLLDFSEASIRKIKDSAESCIIGMLSMQTMLTGKQLAILSNIKFI